MRVFLSIACIAVLAALGNACTVQAPAAAPVPDTPTAPLPASTPTNPQVAVVEKATTTGRSVDLGSGNAVPEVELALLDGGIFRLSDQRGKVVVLNFWASWCPPCRKEMPAFEKVWREFKEQGVVFVGVAVSDTEEDARDFADKIGITYPLGLDTTGGMSRAYRVLALPTTVFIDSQGNESRRIASAVNEGVLRFFIKGLLDGE